MEKIPLPPNAASLLNSIRSIGYTFESALADIIDNSITAGAENVEISFSSDADAEPYVAILDDGCGMNEEELTEAMRHGCVHKVTVGESSDLGRFGLGLKTASLSQCKKLTVISRKQGFTAARQWDFDTIILNNDWTLLALDTEEYIDLPLAKDLEKRKSGTLVIWQNLDRVEDINLQTSVALAKKIDQARTHLGLVFHRFLKNDNNKSEITICINCNPITPADPFLQHSRKQENLYSETVLVENEKVTITPFILPHRNRLKQADLVALGGEESLKTQQGFYIYRNRRLIIWGTWFRLIRQHELTKLARVRVDIPNTLDHLWALDVKKATAFPPEVVRHAMSRIVDKIAENSKRIFVFKGRTCTDKKHVRAWERVELSTGNVIYKINRNHPLVESLKKEMNEKNLRLYDLSLNAIELSYPAHSLYMDMANDNNVENEESEMKEALTVIARQLLEVADLYEGARDRLLNDLKIMEPFCNYTKITEQIIEEMLPCQPKMQV